MERGPVVPSDRPEIEVCISKESVGSNQAAAGNQRKCSRKQIEFQIDECPPIHLCFVYAFQVIFINLPGNVLAVFIVHGAVCGGRDYVFMAQLMSSVIFCSGLATLLQVTLGCRLPITQGSSFIFFSPIIALMSSDEWKCPELGNDTAFSNVTSYAKGEEPWRIRLLEVSGGLVAASLVEVLLGLTGIVGVLMRFVGPLTIAPTLMLITLSQFPVATKSCQHQWGVAFLMVALTMLFAIGLGEIRIPIPTWSRKRGFYVERYPLLRMFSNLLTIGICWLLCYVLTVTGNLPEDPNEIGYLARTDAKMDAITNTQWLYIPYPGQFGAPRWGLGISMGMLAATLSSIIESVGDYHATATICNVPALPRHALNRGIAMEGLASVFSGLIGTCHGTTSYSTAIGFIAYTGVASRMPWVMMSVILMVIAVFGKLAGAIATIPEPILGGIALVGLGLVLMAGISQLHPVDLVATRNQMGLGVALMLGLMMPVYMESNKNIIKTGSGMVDQVISIFLSTGPFVGGVTGLVLDNLLPGTRAERGMVPLDHLSPDGPPPAGDQPHVYDLPFCADALRRSTISRYIPVMPSFSHQNCGCSTAGLLHRRQNRNRKCSKNADGSCSEALQPESAHGVTSL